MLFSILFKNRSKSQIEAESEKAAEKKVVAKYNTEKFILTKEEKNENYKTKP